MNEREVGRMLCRAFYRGELVRGECLWGCVEGALCSDKYFAAQWRLLMTGDLAKLNQSARLRALGGWGRVGVFNDIARALEQERGWTSVDGGKLYGMEVLLYDAVGASFVSLFGGIINR